MSSGKLLWIGGLVIGLLPAIALADGRRGGHFSHGGVGWRYSGGHHRGFDFSIGFNFGGFSHGRHHYYGHYPRVYHHYYSPPVIYRPAPVYTPYYYSYRPYYYTPSYNYSSGYGYTPYYSGGSYYYYGGGYCP